MRNRRAASPAHVGALSIPRGRHSALLRRPPTRAAQRGPIGRALLHLLRGDRPLSAGEVRRMAGAAPSDDDHCSLRRQGRATTEDGRPGCVHAPTIRGQAFRPRAQDAVPRRRGLPPPYASGPGPGRGGRGTSAGSRPPRSADRGRADCGAVRPTATHGDQAVTRVRTVIGLLREPRPLGGKARFRTPRRERGPELLRAPVRGLLQIP